MIDLFTIRPYDTEEIGTVIDLLTEHCDTQQVEQFLADFTRWHRIQGHRATERDREDARIALEEWQRFLTSLSETAP